MKKCIITNTYFEFPEQRKVTIATLSEKQKEALSRVFPSQAAANRARKETGMYNEGWQVVPLDIFPNATPYLEQ